MFDTDSADFSARTVSLSSSFIDDEESSVLLSLREADRKFGTVTHEGDSDYKSSVGWEESEGFNIGDDDLDSFRQAKNDICLAADDYRASKAKLTSLIDHYLEEQKATFSVKLDPISTEY